MTKPIIIANAVTTVSTVGYLLCWILAFLLPDALFAISQSWVHIFNLRSIQANASMGFGSAFFGLITFSVLIWVCVYASASLYAKWSK